MSDEKRSNTKLDEWQRKIIEFINSIPEKKNQKKSDSSFFKTELDEAIENFNHDVLKNREKQSSFNELDSFFEVCANIKDGDVLEIKE